MFDSALCGELGGLLGARWAWFRACLCPHASMLFCVIWCFLGPYVLWFAGASRFGLL